MIRLVNSVLGLSGALVGWSSPSHLPCRGIPVGVWSPRCFHPAAVCPFQRLRHASIRSTEIYTHLSEPLRRDLRQLLGDFFADLF